MVALGLVIPFGPDLVHVNIRFMLDFKSGYVRSCMIYCIYV